MKSNYTIRWAKHLSILVIVLSFFGCENDPKDFQEATYSTNPNVFIDSFSASLGYGAFGGSVLTAFQVDSDVTFNNSDASMRFDVPSVNNPEGTYAGGTFLTSVPRDLSGYDALTFWAKSTQGAIIDVVGFGSDFGANKYVAKINGLNISSTWKKYIIPIPNPSKLKAEKGMLLVSDGPENGIGYSFWFDDVKFEKLGTLAHGQASILNGQNVVRTFFVGVNDVVNQLIYTANLPNGINQAVNVSPSYFEFSSSNPAVATVDANGNVSVLSAGTTDITATFDGQTALGSLKINSTAFQHAPLPPPRNAANVISIFSEAYPNVPVNYYNGYYEPFQTTLSADFTVNGDNVLNYTNFNFVGIEFSAPTVNATVMTNMHLDLYLPNAVLTGTTFKIKLVDFGADGAFGGTGVNSDITGIYNVTGFVSQNWLSLNIPLSSVTGLTTRSHLAQIIFEGTNISNFYADNIYLFKP